MNNPFQCMAWCAVALAGLFVATAAQGQSYGDAGRRSHNTLEGRYVNLSIVDRARGDALPVHPHRNRHYLAGEPGRAYRIQLTNTSSERLMAVVAVDGINVVNGQTANYNQVGYVLEPGQTANIDGWRKSMTRVAQFTFATLPESYAAQTGRADQVGVIGVAVFRERYRRPSSPMVMQDKSAESSVHGAPAPSTSRSIGTGHGGSQWSPVGTTTFERASSQPAEVVRLDYDRRSVLVRRGIIREQRPSRWDEPETFPGQFVPDPPRYR